MRGAFGLSPGELLAVELAPGSAWIDVVHRCWSEGVAFLPVDIRLSVRERRALIDRAQPTGLLDAPGEVTLFTTAPPVSEEVAVFVATSGTSGVPRAVELGRSAVGAAVTGSATALGSPPGDAWVSCLTPAHIGGSLVLLRAEITGAPVVALDEFDPRVVGETIASGSSVSLVPTMVGRLLDARVDVSPARLLLVGGATLDPGLRTEAEARGARIVQTYGLTESCGGVVYEGVPFEGTSVRLGGDDRIELRGPTLMEGYRADPAATGAAFDTRGWLRTGDAGRLDDGGRLHFVGRLDDAIRTGGETVWPEEVERELLLHPKVRDVAVVGRPDPDWGARVVAFVVPADAAHPPRLDDLRGHVKESLAAFAAPRELVLVPSLPRTALGKVRRSALG